MTQTIIIAAIRSIVFMLCAILARGQTLDLPAPTGPLSEVRDLLAKGESWEAIRVLRKQPETPQVKLWLGLAYYFAGQYKLVELKLTEASRALPEDPFPPYALGRFYLDIRQQADQARPQFEEALRRAPRYKQALYHLGWCYELDQKTEKAAEFYRQASGYWLAHAGLARISSSLEEARRAIELEPDAAMARQVYGRLLDRSGDCANAIGQFERAAQLDPTDAGSLYQAMRCAQKMRDTARAKRLLDRYRQVAAIYGPGN